MKAKEKAKELVEKFTMDNTRQGERNGIKCALIAVQEIINDDWYIASFRDLEKRKMYWLEIKNEIEKL